MRSEFTSCCTLESFVLLGMDIVTSGCGAGGWKNLLFLHNHNTNTTDYLNKYDLRRWKAAFGVRPIVAYDAWLRVRNKANARGLRTLHLFWCLHWMKTYATEDNISQKLNTSPKTFREKVRLFVKLLAKEMPSVVKWSNRLAGCQKGERYTVTVDGTDFSIQEPKREDGKKGVDKRWYSHKFKGAGLRYEIAVAIYSDHIVWVNGPFPCGDYSDLKIYKEKGLAEKLIAAGERCVADGTYRHYTVSQKGRGRPSWRHQKNRFRARHETVNNRIKIFDCFKHLWRHSHELHGYAVKTAVFLTQISFPFNPLMETCVDSSTAFQRHK